MARRLLGIKLLPEPKLTSYGVLKHCHIELFSLQMQLLMQYTRGQT